MVDPIFLILIPLAAAFLVSLVNISARGLSPYIAFLALAADTALAISLVPEVMGRSIEVRIAGVEAPLGINLIIGPLGVLLALVILITALLVSIYAFSYVTNSQKGTYSSLFLLLVTGSLGMVLTGDIFNLFVFFEILCISSYILVAYSRDGDSLEASFKYLILGSIGSLLMLTAIALIYGELGSLNIMDIAARAGELSPGTRLFAAVLFTVGIGVESAVFPLNSWLPDAHSSAPSTISAVLSGFVIEVALVSLVKLIYTFFVLPQILGILAVVGVVTLLVGEFAAYRQERLKRMLAYSSIGQVGLILFALSIGSEPAMRGAFLQIINHAAAKSVLFLSAGYFIVRTGSVYTADYRGLARKMPVSGFLFFFAVLSLVGVPPFFGFFSKFSIVTAALQGASAFAATLTGLVLLATVIEAAYFVRVLQYLYAVRDDEAAETGRREAPFSALLPMLILGLFLLTAALGLDAIGGLAAEATREIFSNFLILIS
jgi:proton-translocating NADH-quinone oxidoreductase chain N